MPAGKWDDERLLKLMRLVLAVGEVRLGKDLFEAISKRWEGADVPTPKAIELQLYKLKKEGQGGNGTGEANGAQQVKKEPKTKPKDGMKQEARKRKREEGNGAKEWPSAKVVKVESIEEE